MKLHIFLFLVFTFCFSVQSAAKNSEQAQIDSLLSELDTTKNDTNKVYLYVDIFYNYIYYKAEEGLKYEKPALQLVEKMKWKMGVAIIKYQVGRIYWRLGKFDMALKEHLEVLRISREEDNNHSIASAYTAIGQDYADAGNYPEASINLKNALDIFEKTADIWGQSNVLNLLSWVYSSQGNYSESTKYNYASLKLFEKAGDEGGIATALSNIAEDQFHLGKYEEAISGYRKSLQLQLKLNDKINAIGSYNFMAKAYKFNGNYNSAIENYLKGLKLGTEVDDKISIAVSNEGIGSVYFIQGKYADALNYFTNAAVNYETVSNKLELASLYSEMGACYSKLKMFKDAKKYFDDALKLSNELNSNVSFENYYKGKEIYDSLTGNWESAYKNFKHYIIVRDSSFNKESISKMISTQMQYDTEKKEAAEKAEQDKKDYRQRTIRNSIIAAFGGAIIFLVVVYRQRNKISKARKRSDELLLNILPEEVAEELKEKGSADARQFDNVTVMFTDFKDFTQISEKLTPTELVAEIDTCFRAFDEIIHRNNVEKIKTIGDSYMCAGGLPVANNTHAVDVVNAAIEICEFMNKHLIKRKADGKVPFEIRIGIHTGPIVAGIVGVKKFAYDIWGDTVNIASRMESSGIAGEINISSSTFELVKEKFKCTHRGKIQAKNKGEVDMYFLNK